MSQTCNQMVLVIRLCRLTPLSTIFQLDHGAKFYCRNIGGGNGRTRRKPLNLHYVEHLL